ncbi:FAD/NAD(P)-binding protein [Paenibacillus mesotrionivorans]|uniref:FAD/NAD(P)-binding protein n=1 Tax=Paenibacillus mesotrionivorans TaxID=3160968 RepID=A0ACC7P0H8_9BACL
MSLEELNRRVKHDLSCIAFGGPAWVKPTSRPEGHVYDVVIVGGGQSGLGAAFGLFRERIYNVLVIDENPEGLEGPWDTYARMITLRTPKHLSSIDLGVPSLTFRAWWEAQHGPEGWEQVDKIPRGEWMNYLRWFRQVLALPVRNSRRLTLVEPLGEGLHRLHLEESGAVNGESREEGSVDGQKAAGSGIRGEAAPEVILARKVVLATGIQGGGEWHVPRMITEQLPKERYAHTSERIDFEALRGKRIGILGGGASAFDNANYALTEGAAEVHVFVRRDKLPAVNPIRQMEVSGMIERYHTLSDAEKYAVIAHFFTFNQPPTNDTYQRAAAWPGFRLHLGSPWLDVAEQGEEVRVTTPKGSFGFDFLIISTGLLSDLSLRPELRLLEPHAARWADRYAAPPETANLLLDAHPYLTPGFALSGRDEEGKKLLHGVFIFNYSALASCGLSASAISGTRNAVPKLAAAIADQLFTDNREETLENFFAYREEEFQG